MKRVSLLFVILLMGIGIGWYFGYTRPVEQRQRRILTEYQKVRDAFGATDQQMEEFGFKLPEMEEALRRQDEFAAGMGLAAYVMLERGNIDKARERLAGTIATYYLVHQQDGNSNLLAHIESYAATNATLSNAIYGKMPASSKHE